VRKKLILSDGTRDRELQLVGRIVVGRDPSCEVSHDDSLLSRRHAEFVTVGDEVTVRDLGSRNGVFVNGARAAEHRLSAGDIVQIGPLRARYVLDEGARSIVPEEMDAERTAIFRRPADVAPAPPSPIESVGTPAVVSAIPASSTDSVADFDSEEEDVTRLVPAPRMPKPPAPPSGTAAISQPPARVPAPAPAAVIDDEITQFSKAPRFSIPAPVAPAPSVAAPTVAAPTAAAPVASASPASRHVPFIQGVRAEPAPPVNAPGGFVYFAVGTLAFIVLASASPFLASASIGALVLPVGVAVIGTAIVGTLINRRLTRALAGNERKGS
jgi:predicted component of type VI protein secretion system